MKKFKVLLVEDDNETLKGLLRLLKEYDTLIDIDAIVAIDNFSDAKKVLIEKQKFDISILDKELGEGETCFSLIRNIPLENLGILVLNTIDEKGQVLLRQTEMFQNYLVLDKPYNRIGVSKLMAEISNTKGRSKNDFSPILLSIGSKYIPVKQENIVYVEVRNKYCDIHFIDTGTVKKATEQNPLKYYAEILPSNYFHKISDKHLVNLSFIKEIQQGSIGLSNLFDNEQVFLPVPERNMPALKERFRK